MVDFESPLFFRLAKKRTNLLERMLTKPSLYRPEAIELAKYILQKRKESPNYYSYSLSELIDARNHINEEKYPVRTHYLDFHISARKRKETKSLKEVEKRKQIDAIEFNPRLSVKFYKGVNGLTKETEVSLEDLKEYLIDPQHDEYFVIKDSSIELTIHFDFDKYRHGFFFNYFDKNELKNYESLVHGFSKEFAVSFLKNFLKNGKTELQQIEWKTFKKGNLLTVFIYLFLIILFLLIPLGNKYEIIFISEFISTHKEIISSIFSYFFLGAFVVSIFDDRKQFKYFKNLSTKEKFDTISSLLVLIFFTVLILFGKFDLFIK